jgi:predicted nuclease of predicted toxin-antitoxin system
VRLWVDECLSPSLVGVAQQRYEATCNAHRGLLGAKDPALYEIVSKQDWVLVTNNERDFRVLTERGGLHCGLIVLPQRDHAEQPSILEAVLDYIDLHAAEADLSAAAWMTNRVVEYHDEDDSVTAEEWPPSQP